MPWPAHLAVDTQNGVARPPQYPLGGCDVLISGGRFDPIATPAQVNALADLLRERKAQVDVRMQESGHQLTDWDVETARDWLASNAVA